MLVLLAVFCPCHMLGRNAQAIGEHYWTWCLSDAVVRVCLADVNCVLHAFIRQKIRAEKGIEVWMKARALALWLMSFSISVCRLRWHTCTMSRVEWGTGAHEAVTEVGHRPHSSGFVHAILHLLHKLQCIASKKWDWQHTCLSLSLSLVHRAQPSQTVLPPYSATPVL